MILKELFDTVVPYRFFGRGYASFMIKDKRYEVHFKEGFETDSTEIVFNLDHHEKPGLGVTGTGDEILVFSTVLRIVSEYVARENPPSLTYSAWLGEPSRVKLYDRMTKTLGRGWKIASYTSGDEKHYTLTRM